MALHAWHIMKEKISIAPETSAQDVALRLMSSGMPALPVVNDKQEVMGMATEHAVLSAIQQGMDLEKVVASAIMVKTPIIADVNTSPDDLAKLILKHNCCAVITIVKDGKYVGIVSRSMLLDIFTSPHYSRFASKERKGPFVCL